ncbi:hypothetical protein, partial [Pseudomonas aeruginosa]
LECKALFQMKQMGDKPPSVQNRIFGKMGLTSAHFANSFSQPKTLFPCQGLTLKQLSSNSKSITISSGV